MEESGVDIRAFIGVRIKEHRKRHHWKQAELGKMVGAAYNTVASWEKGDREPSMTQLYMMARIFGIGVADFFPSTVGDKVLAMEKGLVTDFRNLNDEGKVVAAAAVKGLSQMDAYSRH